MIKNKERRGLRCCSPRRTIFFGACPLFLRRLFYSRRRGRIMEYNFNRRQIMDNLEYAEMLEIPVNTVNVVKKKSLFKRRAAQKDDLKDDVLANVNSRAEEDDYSARADFIQTEDLSQPEAPAAKKRDGWGGVLLAEAVAACVLAGGIFVTNALVDNTAINNLVAGLTQTAEEEASYTDFDPSPVVSLLSDAEVGQTASGVITFTGRTAVYPVCDGTISSVSESDGLYTVEISHTSSFTSVFTGLSQVYSAEGDAVKANIPFAYSDGANEVRLTMYDGDAVISGYTLDGAVPVWNS